MKSRIGTNQYQKNGGKHPWPVADSILTKDQLLPGKPNIRRPGPIGMTESQIKEWVKCKLDPIYFLKTYGRVVHIDKGLVPLELYPYQEEMILNFKNHRFSINLTCRQAGKTTAVVGFLAWYAIFHSDKDCHVLANKEAQAMEVMKRLRRLFEELPYFLQQGFIEFNKGNILLENGSSVAGHASSSSAIRGMSAALLYVDEMAFLGGSDGGQDFWDSVAPVVSSGEESKILITSTPKGARGIFYTLWQGAIAEGEKWNGYVPLTVTWKSVPGRTEDWAIKTKNTLGSSRFSQEHECKFLGSAGTLIDSDGLAKMNIADPLITFDNNNVQILYPPEKDGVYVATVDCAEGVGADSSVVSMFDVSQKPYRMVAKYKCNTISPLLFPYEIEKLCKQYNDAWVLIESNAIGSQVIQILYYEIQYSNVFLTSNQKDGLGTQINGAGAKPGLKTTSTTKNKGCTNLKTLIETDLIVIEDIDAVSELGTFVVNKTGSYEADTGCHDDVVMTLVLFAWLCKTTYFADVYDSTNSIQDSLKKISEQSADLLMNQFFSHYQIEREKEKMAIEEAKELSDESLTIEEFYERAREAQWYNEELSDGW